MSLHASVVEFFEEDDWPFASNEEGIFQTGFKGKSGQWTCIAQAIDRLDLVVFYSICPNNVPEHRREAMADFLTRANYGLYIGNFEMDYSDGEIRYKTSVDFEGGVASAALIKRLVYANVSTMDRYFDGIMTVMYSDKDPAVAIAEVEDS